MTKDRVIIGACPKCSSSELVCSYNHFENDSLTIDSWEHKCPNCGLRETKARRSDDEDSSDQGDPTICPYCARRPKSDI